MNVTTARLSDWRDRVEHAVETALKERTGDDQISRLKAPSRLRLRSQSAKARLSTSAPSPRTSPPNCSCITVMAQTTCLTTSRRRSPFSASRHRHPSSVNPKATASPTRFTRLLKENLLWVRNFKTIEELRPLELRPRASCTKPIYNPNQDQGKSNRSIRSARIKNLRTLFIIGGIKLKL
jgi:hypothetical protein